MEITAAMTSIQKELTSPGEKSGQWAEKLREFMGDFMKSGDSVIRQEAGDFVKEFAKSLGKRIEQLFADWKEKNSSFGSTEKSDPVDQTLFSLQLALNFQQAPAVETKLTAMVPVAGLENTKRANRLSETTIVLPGIFPEETVKAGDFPAPNSDVQSADDKNTTIDTGKSILPTGQELTAFLKEALPTGENSETSHKKVGENVENLRHAEIPVFAPAPDKTLEIRPAVPFNNTTVTMPRSKVRGYLQIGAALQKAVIHIDYHRSPVRIYMEIQGDELTAKLHAFGPATLHLLQQNLTELKNTLACQGLQVNDIDVVMSDQGFSGTSQGFSDSSHHGAFSQTSPPIRNFDIVELLEEPLEANRRALQGQNGKINYYV